MQRALQLVETNDTKRRCDQGERKKNKKKNVTLMQYNLRSACN